MERTITTYKPSISKKWFLLVSGILWFFASTMLIRSGTFFMFDYSHHILFNIAVGFLGGLILFAVVFYSILKKDVSRIVKTDNERFSILSITGLKGYVVVAILISAGILLKRFHYIDMMNQHIFYISLGTAMLIASMKFFYSLLIFKKLSISLSGRNN